MCEESTVATALPQADESPSDMSSNPIFWKYATGEAMVLGTRCHARARVITLASRYWSSYLREVSMRDDSWGCMGGELGMDGGLEVGVPANEASVSDGETRRE